MSEPKYRQWILETIDSLRSRKARPDLERICRMVRRRHGSDPDRTRTELEKLIQQQTVLKVSYKGSISYRNAAKVQRKSRKKTEFAPACSTGCEESRERTDDRNISNNGDSPHSFTDQEESEPCLHPRTKTQTSAPENANGQPSTARCGSVRFRCGATPRCGDGSGCQAENASASNDPESGAHLRVGCPSPGHDQTMNSRGCDTDSIIPPNTANGKERALCHGATGGSSCCEAAGTKKDTCPPVNARSTANDATSTEKQEPPAALKPQIGGSDLGDGVVSSVRSLPEGNLRARSSAGGQMKQLGLREVPGYRSGQELLSEEKLTKGKVRGVLEREIARGRLRRTLCGNIALPLRGVMVVAAPEEHIAKNMSAARPLNGLAQGMNTVDKERDGVEAGCGEEEEQKNDRQSAEEQDRTTQSGLDGDAVTETPSESPQNMQQYCGVSVQASLPRTTSLPARDGLHHTTSITPGASAATPTALQSDASARSLPPPFPCPGQDEPQGHASPNFNNVAVGGEVGTQPGPSADHGVNAGPCGGVPLRSEGAGLRPVDWTVSDVASYLVAVGFPEQALAFKAQEIDGRSLLLMQRSDVLTGLSIRLGPAVKIYERHVKALQKTHFEEDDC